MIQDKTAQRIASEWHSGGGSALYALSSTGAITNDGYKLHGEILDCYGPNERHKELEQLSAYIEKHGPRGPVPGWYEKTIARQK